MFWRNFKTRDEMINFLVDYESELIDGEAVKNILLDGLTGYNDMSDNDIIDIYNDMVEPEESIFEEEK